LLSRRAEVQFPDVALRGVIWMVFWPESETFVVEVVYLWTPWLPKFGPAETMSQFVLVLGSVPAAPLKSSDHRIV
jgi:hypothetical protein